MVVAPKGGAGGVEDAAGPDVDRALGRRGVRAKVATRHVRLRRRAEDAAEDVVAAGVGLARLGRREDAGARLDEFELSGERDAGDRRLIAGGEDRRDIEDEAAAADAVRDLARAVQAGDREVVALEVDDRAGGDVDGLEGRPVLVGFERIVRRDLLDEVDVEGDVADSPGVVADARHRRRRLSVGRVVRVGDRVVRAGDEFDHVLEVGDRHGRADARRERREVVDGLVGDGRNGERGDDVGAAVLDPRDAGRGAEGRRLAGEPDFAAGDRHRPGEVGRCALEDERPRASLVEADGADKVAVDRHGLAGWDVDRGRPQVAEDPDAVRGRGPILVDLQRRAVRDDDVGDVLRRGVAGDGRGVHKFHRDGGAAVPGADVAREAGEVARDLVREHRRIDRRTGHGRHPDRARSRDGCGEDVLLADVVRGGRIGAEVNRRAVREVEGTADGVAVEGGAVLADRVEHNLAPRSHHDVAERERLGQHLVAKRPDAVRLDDDGGCRRRGEVRPTARLRPHPAGLPDVIDGVVRRDAVHRLRAALRR